MLVLVTGLRRDCYVAGSCIGLPYRPVLGVSATPPRREPIQRREISNRSYNPPKFKAVWWRRDSEHIHAKKASRCCAAWLWWSFMSAELLAEELHAYARMRFKAIWSFVDEASKKPMKKCASKLFCGSKDRIFIGRPSCLAEDQHVFTRNPLKAN